MVAEITSLDEIRAERGAQIEVRAGELPRLLNEAQSALVGAGAGIYQRGGALVRIVRLESEAQLQGVRRTAGTLIISPVTREYMTAALARSATWLRWDARAKKLRPIDPPSAIAAGLLAIAGEWRFPVLTGIVSAPTLRADGSLLSAPGYDRQSGLYANFDGADFPPITAAPARDEALAALDVLDDLFSECQFSGGDRSAHASVAIAATITAAVRHALSMAPAFGIGAYKQSSGKTTLARAISHVTTGREPPVLALSEDEAELRKCLLGILLAGDACVLIDNVNRPVDSAALCALLTSSVYSDRMLGMNVKVSIPTSSTWLITGNHLEFVGDLTTRVVLSLLDPQTERPEERVFRRDIAAYITAHRGTLIAAALTVPLAYLAAGEPAVEARPSRFADWDRLVRRPLLWLNASDPIATQAELQAADPEREALVAVLHAWRTAFRDRSATVAELIQAATAPGQSAALALLEAAQAVAGERNGAINTRRLGRYLVRHLRRIEDGMRLEDMGSDPLTHRRRFKVASVSGVFDVISNPTREMSVTF